MEKLSKELQSVLCNWFKVEAHCPHQLLASLPIAVGCGEMHNSVQLECWLLYICCTSVGLAECKAARQAGRQEGAGQEGCIILLLRKRKQCGKGVESNPQ